MVRRIIAGLVLVLLVYLGWTWYRGRAEKATLASGEYTCQGCLEGDAKARFLKENGGETPDGSSDRKSAPAATAAAQATSGTAQNAEVARTGTVTPVIVPAGNSDTTSNRSAQNGYGGMQGVQAAPPAATNVSARYTSTMGSAPAADTIAANPPNDQHFRGAGTYEWYRQGNLTWRVDTTTGQSCIVYATLDEWRKQIVLSHGCGRNT